MLGRKKNLDFLSRSKIWFIEIRVVEEFLRDSIRREYAKFTFSRTFDALENLVDLELAMDYREKT